MGNGAKSWFRPSGRYPDTFVAGEYGEFALRVVGYEPLGLGAVQEILGSRPT